MAPKNKQPLGITEVVLRDAHQSILATRLRIEDMLPICGQLDEIGYWSIESWGGATFDACIRYLGEDPWERLRLLKAAMPKTPQQMLLRGQNLLGYRHYADDVVDKFVERCAINGIDVFRIFDAMNDMRNIERAVKAVLTTDAHAQGTISYTTSPVHTMDMWVNLGKQIEDMGAHSICIKDMAGLLKPYDAFELVSRLKKSTNIPIHMQCHATTGLSIPSIIKAAEAGIDNVDTAISSLSMTYGHSPTETIVAALEGTDRATGLDLVKLEHIAAYFREVRKKYAQFEGSLKGVDGRILISQVPGGMLTNMESQLKEQGAADKFDDVMLEIPRVREDLGLHPAGHADLANRRHPGRAQRHDRRTLQKHHQGNRRRPQRRIRRHPGPRQQSPARAGAQRRATDHLPPGRPDRAGNGQTDRRGAGKSQGRGRQARGQRRRRRPDQRPVRPGRLEVPGQPRQSGRLRSRTGRAGFSPPTRLKPLRPATTRPHPPAQRISRWKPIPSTSTAAISTSP